MEPGVIQPLEYSADIAAQPHELAADLNAVFISRLTDIDLPTINKEAELVRLRFTKVEGIGLDEAYLTIDGGDEDQFSQGWTLAYYTGMDLVNFYEDHLKQKYTLVLGKNSYWKSYQDNPLGGIRIHFELTEEHIDMVLSFIPKDTLYKNP